jgi:hypothetical protein
MAKNDEGRLDRRISENHLDDVDTLDRWLLGAEIDACQTVDSRVLITGNPAVEGYNGVSLGV